jgi:hypothetical protein
VSELAIGAPRYGFDSYTTHPTFRAERCIPSNRAMLHAAK